jgi:hypothetical protein
MITNLSNIAEPLDKIRAYQLAKENQELEKNIDQQSINHKRFLGL